MMARYRVDATADTVVDLVAVVEADNEDEARSKAELLGLQDWEVMPPILPPTDITVVSVDLDD